MQQPKFLPGQKVKPKTGVPFKISSVYWHKDEWMYAPDEGFFHNKESDLELYQEPQKKKLYAYESDGFIFFKRHESNAHPTNKDVSGYDAINWEHVYKRIPEYDLEYPEENS
jgi:hypothetical protein